jgi:CheY-like chemotaxis protein
MKKIILAVDDNGNDQELLELHLEYSFRKCSFSKKNMPLVIIAKDGEEAWNILTEEKVTPHVMIVDYKMPKIDGIELIKKITKELVIHPMFVIHSDHGLAEDEAKKINCRFIPKGERNKFFQLTEEIGLFSPL